MNTYEGVSESKVKHIFTPLLLLCLQEDGFHAGEVEEKSFAVSALSSMPSHFADRDSLGAFL